MVNAAESAATTVIQSIPSGDPVIDAVKWVIALVVLIASAIYPIAAFLRKNRREEDGAKLESVITTAGSTIYTQLVAQLDEQRKLALSAATERGTLQDRIVVLEHQVAAHTDAVDMVVKLRGKLDDKDREIAALLAQASKERDSFLEVLKNKDGEIAKRDARILHLERSVAALNIRLARDEGRQVFGAHVCPITQAVAKGKEIPAAFVDAVRDACLNASQELSVTESIDSTQ